MAIDKLSNLAEISTGELQLVLRKMIDEIELRKGIGIYTACERIAIMLFEDGAEQRQWLEGCISPEVLEYFRLAAAPDLLAACEELFNDCRNMPADEQRQKVMQKAKAAIAKAKP